MPSCRHVLVHVLVSVHDILAMVVYASCSLVSGSGAMVPHTVVYCVVTLRNALVYVCVCVDLRVCPNSRAWCTHFRVAEASLPEWLRGWTYDPLVARPRGFEPHS